MVRLSAFALFISLLCLGCESGALGTNSPTSPESDTSDSTWSLRDSGTDVIVTADGATQDTPLPDTPLPDALFLDARSLDSDGDEILDVPGEPGEPDCPPRARSRADNPSQNASWRYGGGAGYPDMVVRDERCMSVVSTIAQLEGALAAARAGDIVYVADDATIDMAGKSLCIPGGVWLASGRGQSGSPGGLIHTTQNSRTPILRACGDDVRITGLRIYGNDAGQCPPEYPDNCTQPDRTGGRNCRDCTPSTYGVQARNHDGLEVDNCELAGWSAAAIALTDSVRNLVRFNDIHHTQRQGLGYGVLLGRGATGTVDVTIEYNRFDYNRHAVAGSGEPGQDYIARHNLVLPHANGHVFDMHGHNENTDNGSPLAGGRILIHDNTVLVPNHYALVVRGRPEQGSWLYNNCLARNNAAEAALQRHFFGNFYVDSSPQGPAPNRYGQRPSDCERVRWCHAPAASGPWTYNGISSASLTSLAIGDFDGDGISDVFQATGSEWRWVKSATGRWQTLNTSTATLDRLAFGDFNGDGKTDVFTATGTRWRVSDGGTRPWRDLRNATDSLGDIAFGDFDGDGITDVFRTAGGKWQWSKSGTGPWQDLNTSGVTLDQLVIGDFDGDGIADIFQATGSEWRWSKSGRQPWQTLNTSTYRSPQMAFGDFNGDGKTDIFRTGADGWYVSWAGRTSWRRVRIASEPLSELAFGDFNGDGKTDVFRTGCL